MGDVELVVEHRAPRRLGRMRGEDELELQRAHRGGQVGPGLAQQVRRLEQRLPLAHAGGVVVAPPAHPLALLGDVGELELQRARADAWLKLVGRERVDQLEQRRAGSAAPSRSSEARSCSRRTASAKRSPLCSTSTSCSTSSSSSESRWRPSTGVPGSVGEAAMVIGENAGVSHAPLRRTGQGLRVTPCVICTT